MKLVLVSFTLIYTLSAACALVLPSYINVCVTQGSSKQFGSDDNRDFHICILTSLSYP